MNLVMEDLGFTERSITLGNNILLYCELETDAHFSGQNSAFLEKSAFHISKQHGHFPQAIFGSDEPHAAMAQSKLEEMHMEEKDVQNNLQRKLRGQLLFFGITMGLLAEIINSRFFTNIWDSFGLTYDVSFELNLFDRLKLGWYVISVTSTPGKAKLILLRNEAEIKSNAYWLGLLGHLQAAFVTRKDISCIKDLISQYEAASIEGLAYDQLKVDDNSLYSCVGIPGSQAVNEITSEDESHEGFPGVIPMGRVLSTISRPTA